MKSTIAYLNWLVICILPKIHITFHYPFWVWYLAYFYFHQVIAYELYLNCTSFTGLFYSLEKNQVNCNIKTKNKNTLWTKSHLRLLICNVLLACELLQRHFNKFYTWFNAFYASIAFVLMVFDNQFQMQRLRSTVDYSSSCTLVVIWTHVDTVFRSYLLCQWMHALIFIYDVLMSLKNMENVLRYITL